MGITRARTARSIFGGGIATVPTAAMRNGDFRGTAIAPRDPQTGLPFPDRVIPSNRIDPSARAIDGLLLSAAQSVTDGKRIRAFPAVRAQDPRTSPRRHQARLPAWQQRFGVRPWEFSAPQSEQHYLRGGERFHASASLECRAQHRVGRRRLDEDFLADHRQRVPRWLQLRQLEAREHVPLGGAWRRSSASRTRRASRRTAAGSRLSSSRPERTDPPTSPMQGRNVDRTLRQNAFSISDNVTWIRGGHTLKGGGLWTSQHRSRRFWLRRQFPRAISVQRIVHRQCLYGFPVGSAVGCA